MKSISTLLTIPTLIIGLTGCGGPTNDTIKQLAKQHILLSKLNDSEIHLLKKYENDGQTIAVLQTEKFLCEMSMFKGSDAWLATNMECKPIISPQATINKILELQKENNPPIQDQFHPVQKILGPFDAKLNSGKQLDMEMNLFLTSQDLADEIDFKTITIKDLIFRIIGSKDDYEVSSANGKEKLKEQIITQLNMRLRKGRITDLYFTSFSIK